MNLLQRSFSSLRTWLGLGDASDDHLTPSHGWLLPELQGSVILAEEVVVAPSNPPLR